MGPLQVKMSKRDKALKEKNADREIPVFGNDGRIKKKVRKIPKKGIAIAIVFVVLLSIIYVPGFFMHKELQNSFTIQPDATGIQKVSEAAKNDPESDYDEDGLTNSLESRYNTSVRNPDSDDDGVCDYAELFITQTDPNEADDALYNTVIKSEEITDVSEPYKIYNVILWPDDMNSRVYGGLVRTQLGYRFCNFTGWAQFPEGNYAYKMEDGVHIALEHREAENAWRIEDDSEVVLTDEPLEMVHALSIKGIGEYYIADNLLGKILSAILPQNGLITCQKMARIDTWTDANNIITAPIVAIEYDETDLSRYKENDNLLTDLAMVYASINEGSSVLVSLNSTEYGEVIAEIYGYTLSGELLVADPNTLEPAGTITITEKTERFMDSEGEIIYREYYDFYGLGYDSTERFDRINFFAAAVEGNPFEGSVEFQTSTEESTEQPIAESNTNIPQSTESTIPATSANVE